MLPLTDETFHTLGPKDLGIDPEKKSIMSMDIAKTTNHTGEQIHIAVPIYADDDRIAVSRRLGFAYSLIQDRMEAENKALKFVKGRSLTIHRGEEIIGKNEQHFANKLKALTKLVTKGKMSEKEFVVEKEHLIIALKESNEATQADVDHARKEIEAAKELPKE